MNASYFSVCQAWFLEFIKFIQVIFNNAMEHFLNKISKIYLINCIKRSSHTYYFLWSAKVMTVRTKMTRKNCWSMMKSMRRKKRTKPMMMMMAFIWLVMMMIKVFFFQSGLGGSLTSLSWPLIWQSSPFLTRACPPAPDILSPNFFFQILVHLCIYFDYF